MKYSISELAREVDVPASTVRYYERRGLVEPVGRTAGNYRFYDDATVERLRFVRAAQSTGFTLEDVSVLLAFSDGKTSPCAEVQGLIERRLSDVEQRLRDLKRVRNVLGASLDICKQNDGQADCQVLDNLQASAKPRAKSRRRSK